MLAIAVLFVLALVASLVAFLPHRTIIHPSCAFGDGLAYCRMAEGRTAQLPWARRPVVPLLTRVVPGSLAQRFRVISILGLITVSVLSALLADRVARRLRVHDPLSRLTIAAIVVTGGLIMPNAIRQALSVPVLIDHGGLAFGLTWILLFTARDSRANMPAAIPAFLAVLSHEVWILVIPIASASVIVTARARRAATVNILAVVVAVGVMQSLPSLPALWLPGRYNSEVIYARDHYWNHFDGLHAAGDTLWFLVFAAGLLPVVIVMFPPVRWLGAELRDGNATAAIMLLASFVIMASAPLAADITRDAYPAGVLLLAFSAPWIMAHRTLWRGALVLALGTLFVWAPTHHLIKSPSAYVAFYYPYSRDVSGFAVTAIALAVAGAFTAADERRLRQRETQDVTA